VEGQVLREAAASFSKAGSNIVESVDILMAFAAASQRPAARRLILAL
jgi:hypothetical protein